MDIVWQDAAYPADTAGMMAAIAAAFDLEPNSTVRDDGDVTAAIEGTEIVA